VNGRLVRELGTKALPSDRITIDGRPLAAPETFLYLLLNKPTGVVSTVSDPQGRPTVLDLLGKIRQRVFPVGRLDYHSGGLLLLTNDGELALRLTHPRYHVAKTYRVKVKGRPTAHALARLGKGIRFTEGRTAPAKVRIVESSERKTWLEITIAEGKRRQVRRMCEAVGLPVEKLVRIALGPLKLGRLAPGQFRPLTDEEIGKLAAAVGKKGDKSHFPRLTSTRGTAIRSRSLPRGGAVR
jgi:23S rRNA pseudouridine2605 synthase